MYPKKYRLRKNADVLRVLKRGQFVRGGMVSLKCLRWDLRRGESVLPAQAGTRPQKGDPAGRPYDVSRVAVIASVKVLRRAVDRNRAKRLVRESVRYLLPQIKSGYDLVFLIQSIIVGKKQPEVQKEVEWLLRKGRLLEMSNVKAQISNQ